MQNYESLKLSLVDYINSVPHSSPFISILHQIIQNMSPAFSMEMSIDDTNLSCGSYNVDLQTKPKILDVYQAFLRDEKFTLDRLSLVKAVYLMDDLSGLSQRQLTSLSLNVVKLISRARKIAKKHFDASLSPHLVVDWFPYDLNTKTWSLYRIRNNSLYFKK